MKISSEVFCQNYKIILPPQKIYTYCHCKILKLYLFTYLKYGLQSYASDSLSLHNSTSLRATGMYSAKQISL